MSCLLELIVVKYFITNLYLHSVYYDYLLYENVNALKKRVFCKIGFM